MGAERDDEGTSGDEMASMIAGIGPDLEVQQMVEEEERKRKAKEAAEGKGVKVVEYTPNAGGPKVTGIARTALIILILAMILVPLLYFVVIPRADAELIIEYNEGLVGGINVDARIDNKGTRTMEDVTITILVQNSTDVRMSDPSHFIGRVSAHNWQGMNAISFTGDQWDTYHIFVEYSFDCAGRTYTGSEHIVTEGQGMNKWYYLDMTA